MSQYQLPGRPDDTPLFHEWHRAFVVCLDEGEWWTTKESSFDWRLRPGVNRVVVRARNKKGILGPPSDAEVRWHR